MQDVLSSKGLAAIAWVFVFVFGAHLAMQSDSPHGFSLAFWIICFFVALVASAVSGTKQE